MEYSIKLENIVSICATDAKYLSDSYKELFTEKPSVVSINDNQDASLVQKSVIRKTTRK